jgi:hypothetical protein
VRERLLVCATKQKERIFSHMRSTPRRGVHQSDLPLRFTIADAGKRCFRYLIVRNDGTVAVTSARLFATEAAARVAGLPVVPVANLVRLADDGESGDVVA